MIEYFLPEMLDSIAKSDVMKAMQKAFEELEVHIEPLETIISNSVDH